MNIVLKGFDDSSMLDVWTLIKQYKQQWLTKERMGSRKGVIYKYRFIPGIIYIYHTKTQIVAIHSKE